MSDIRVLHVCETARGGPATYLNLVVGVTLTRANFIVLPEDSQGDIVSSAQLRPFVRSGRGVRGLVNMVRAMRQSLRQDRPDILFFHSTFALAGLVAARFLAPGIPKIYCAHGWALDRYPAGSWKRRLVQTVERLVPRLADSIVCISHKDERTAQALGLGDKAVLVENAVAGSRHAPRVVGRDAQSGLKLVFVGRFDRQKGLDFLLDSFAQAHSARPDLELTIVGAQVLDSAQDRRDQPGVVYKGWMNADQLDQVLLDSDLLVMPSRWEGFGLVLIEAFRNGTPGLVSDQGALPDIVTPGQTGLVCGLSASAWTRTLVSLDRQVLDAMRPACVTTYETRFSADRFHRELGELYARLVSRSGPQRGTLND